MGFIREREKDSWIGAQVQGKNEGKREKKKLINKKNPMIRILSKLDCN